MGAWDDALVDKLVKLVKSGHTCRQIARILKMTRNQVLGKAHRVGLQFGSPSLRQKSKTSSRNARNLVKAWAGKRGKDKTRSTPWPALIHEPIPDRRANDIARRTLAALEPGECKFPVGDVGQPGFGFCGLSQVPGLAYCPDHAARCLIPVAVAKSKSGNENTPVLDASDVSRDASASRLERA